MNSYTRVFHAIEGKEIDCIPVAPYNGNFSIHLAGYKLDECYLDGKKLADAQYTAWEQIGQDVIVAQSDQYYLAEALGVKTAYRYDQLPEVLDVPVKDLLRDVPKLKSVDPLASGRACVYLEAIERLHKKVQKEVPVRAPGCGAFVLAGHLMGVNNFIMEIAAAEAEEDVEKQESLLQLVEIATQTLCMYGEACVKAGADIVQDADSLASLDMISPAIYEKYAYPFEKKFFAHVNALKEQYSFATLLHICGNNGKVAPLLKETGCDILEVDYKADLEMYKKIMGKDICLLGNMNPAGNILQGSPDDVEQEAEISIRKGWKGGHYILGSGCEVAVDAPVENIKALVRYGHSSKPWDQENEKKM